MLRWREYILRSESPEDVVTHVVWLRLPLEIGQGLIFAGRRWTVRHVGGSREQPPTPSDFEVVS